MQRKFEIIGLGAAVLLGVTWAVTTDHLPKDWFTLDYLIDLSSLLTVASFSVRGMLPLRVLAAGSQVIAIPYFVLQPTPLWTPVGWTALFLAINLYHILRIVYERRPVSLTSDEQRLYDLTFQSLEPRSFLQLARLGEWKDATKGERILTRAQPIESVAIPISGAAAALLDEVRVGSMMPGEFIGARMALTGRKAEFDFEFAEKARYIRWSVSHVKDFLEHDADLKIKFSEILNRHLAAQLDKFTTYFREGGSRGSP